MKIDIYGTPTCHWCSKAKDLLSSRQIEYNSIHVGKDISIVDFSARFPGFTKVPQIIINGEHVGGYDDLARYLEDHANGFGDQK